MKTSCLRLKLVELNFFASFNADDQRKFAFLTYLKNFARFLMRMQLHQILLHAGRTPICETVFFNTSTVPFISHSIFPRRLWSNPKNMQQDNYKPIKISLNNFYQSNNCLFKFTNRHYLFLTFSLLIFLKKGLILVVNGRNHSTY